MSIASHIHSLCELAEGADCPLYAGRKAHHDAVIAFMAACGFYDRVDAPGTFRTYFGESITPRELAEFVAEDFRRAADEWQDAENFLLEQIGASK